MKIFIFIALLLSQSLFANSFSEVGLPIIKNYSQDAYKAHNQNWDIVQAKNKLIYVANGNGLLEFDGEKWNKYYTPNRSRIRDIELVDTRIYAGTVNDIGYFEANDKGVLVYHSLNQYLDKELLSFGEVWSVVSYKSLIIFKTLDYFFIWDGRSIAVIKDLSKSRVKMLSFEDEVYIKLVGSEEVYLINPKNDNFLNKTKWKLPKDAQIRAIKKDKNGNLIFFTGKYGIFKQNFQNLKVFDDVFKKGDYLYDVMQSQDGLFYVATVNAGLYVLSEQLKPLKNYQDFHGLGMNAITSLMSDSQNNIWLAGNKAISVMRPPDEISRYKKSKESYGFNFKMLQNKLSFLGQGLFQLQENHQNILFPPRFEKVEGTNYDIWDSLDFQDKTFLAINKGLILVKLKQNKTSETKVIFEKSLFAYNIVATNDFKQLFVATSLGLYRIQEQQNQWQVNLVEGIGTEVNYLAIENDEVLWVGNSSSQLYRLEIDSLNSMQANISLFDKKDGTGNNKVVPFNLSTGLVFATNDGVMYYTGDKDKPLAFVKNMPKIFTTKGQDAHLLYEDSEDRLWYRIGTHSGFAKKTSDNKWQVNEKIFKYFPDRSIYAFIETDKNIIWFMQSDDNIFRMDVKKIQTLPELAPLYIRTIHNMNSGDIIDSGIVSKVSKDLAFDSNSLRISYAMAAYAIPSKALYRTKLNGTLQAKWSEWSDETYRDFTELRGNNYMLEVQAKDGFGRVTTSTELYFTVLPPFYLSQIAFMIYIFLALSIVVVTAWIVQKWRTKKLQEHNVELATLVNEKTIEIQCHVEKLEQQQELKTRFFTNISHELRTPLSLIILPLQKLIKYNKQTLNSESQELLSLSLKNANGMKQLVNQVLDVSRFEEKVMPIAVQNNNLAEFVETVSQKFVNWAKENQQQIVVSQPVDKIELLFDPQMMEKIVSNLISNAIKYSGQATTIKITFFADAISAGFIIKDNGIGIEKSQCQEVFERYFKSNQRSSEHDSSGIGLDFVKEMVDLHQGKIELNSDTACGCEFKLTFKLGKEHFSTVVIEDDINPEQHPVSSEHPEDTPVVLIVEDNTDLRDFISQSLSLEYKVIQAINGADAMQTLKHELPDLIISDIMMPQMDGIEFLQKLREQQQFKTIPFFLLSSKSTQSDTQVGLQYGANDYLTKPFNMDELLLRVRNMINSRKLIRKQLKQQLQEIMQHNNPVELSGFEQKLQKIILDNISDSKFNVMELAKHYGLDRTALFRKAKKELGISPSKYIQETRLKIAKELLDKNVSTVSEVAYASGFESLSYFSKIFKIRYGKAPSTLTKH